MKFTLGTRVRSTATLLAKSKSTGETRTIVPVGAVGTYYIMVLPPDDYADKGEKPTFMVVFDNEGMQMLPSDQYLEAV